MRIIQRLKDIWIEHKELYYWYDEQIVRRLIHEGFRVGKAPWSPCQFSEKEARRRLEKTSGRMYQQETMRETCDRRLYEQRVVVIDEHPYK